MQRGWGRKQVVVKASMVKGAASQHIYQHRAYCGLFSDGLGQGDRPWRLICQPGFAAIKAM